MRKIKFLIFLIILSSCADTKHNIQSEFESIFDSKFSENKPGGIILVKKSAEVIFLKSYGVANLKTREKITENTIFNTGSISKTFVSNGILILEEAQLLSIEDSIYKYFHDFDNKEIALLKKKYLNLQT